MDSLEIWILYFVVTADARQWRGGDRGGNFPQSSFGVSQPWCQKGGHSLSDRLSARLQVSVPVCVTYDGEKHLVTQLLFYSWPGSFLLPNRTNACGVHLLEEKLQFKMGSENLDIEEVCLVLILIISDLNSANSTFMYEILCS